MQDSIIESLEYISLDSGLNCAESVLEVLTNNHHSYTSIVLALKFIGRELRVGRYLSKLKSVEMISKTNKIYSVRSISSIVRGIRTGTLYNCVGRFGNYNYGDVLVVGDDFNCVKLVRCDIFDKTDIIKLPIISTDEYHKIVRMWHDG